MAMDEPARGPLAEESAEFLDLLHRALRAVRLESVQALGPHGTTPGQFRMLNALRCCAGPQRLGALAETLGVVPRSVTSKVDDAESAGLVRRRPDPSDRRATLVELTDAGRAVVSATAAHREASAGGMLARLDPARRATLLRLLRETVGD